MVVKRGGLCLWWASACCLCTDAVYFVAGILVRSLTIRDSVCRELSQVIVVFFGVVKVVFRKNFLPQARAIELEDMTVKGLAP